MKERIYLTTTLPYVNAAPHLGHALEFVQADIIARYLRLSGREVFFNTGTDEHGLKIYTKAFEIKEPVLDYVDRYVKHFIALKDTLGLSFDNFIRTTDKHHIKAAQEFWRRCEQAGDIYKKNYKIKYCIGCELEKTDSELVDGYCPLHPNSELEIIEEENYFFRFSKYQQALLELYDNANFVIPASRLNEIKNFVTGGLEDFSISRLKSKMPWGIDVPGEESCLPAGRQVMYVWFDALVNYVSAIGWPDDLDKFSKWWPAIQFAGKDNLRQQSAMWQAMLLSAGLEPSKQILIHGFITSAGQKMSKSRGNVVDPLQVVGEYGVDALRYYLAREVTPFEDGDFTWDKFKDAYNGNLANGLGNLVSRVIKMYVAYEAEAKPEDLKSVEEWIKDDFFKEYREYLDNYEINKAADFVWTQIKEADLYIQNTQPFKLFKDNPTKAREHVSYLIGALWRISVGLEPLMPSTAQKIRAVVKNKELLAPLFARKD
ncbi:MAG: methionine--tRNA ligase [Patescibacteria group bacterium]